VTWVPRTGQLEGLDRELPVGAGLHSAPLARLPGLARAHLDPLGDDEGRVEADAELADEGGGLLLISRERAEELGRSGAGDGAEVGDRLGARHADAVVGDRDGAGGGVGIDADGEFGVLGHQLAVRDGRKAQPVAGIRGVGDELPQEDLPVAVERVDHELQELTHLRLKAVGLARGRALGGGKGFFGHGSLSVGGVKGPAEDQRSGESAQDFQAPREFGVLGKTPS
jgi:hypothetical protein